MKPPEEVTRDLARQWLGSLRDAPELTPYGVEYRYPGEYPPVSGGAAISSIAIARRVYDEVVERLPEDLRL
jgi:hypothetical protein